MNNKNINSLVKKYILWPELENDFQKNVNFSSMSMLDLKKITQSFGEKKISIEEQMALFYLANEKLAKTRIDSQGVLGEKELKDFNFYQKIMNQLSKQLLAYITVVSIVEARYNETYVHLDWNFNKHLMSLKDPKYKISQLDSYNTYEKKIQYILTVPKGEEFLEKYFNKHIKKIQGKEKFPKFFYFNLQILDKIKNEFSMNTRSKGYKNIATSFLSKSLKDYNIGETLDYLTKIFEINQFRGGFGGIPWSNISRHGLNFVTGKINTEVFIDQSFSLEHNSGNMFNKDYLFKHSANEKYRLNTEYLTVEIKDLILNSQHLGILPSLFNVPNEYNKFESIDKDALFKELKKNNIIFCDRYSFDNTMISLNSMYFTCKRQISPIIESLKEISPELLEQTNEPFDFHKLFSEIAIRNDSFNQKIISAGNSDFFKILKYIQINKLNNIKNNLDTVEQIAEVFDVSNISIEKMNKDIIGGKAWSLANMTNLDLPVPKSKVFTTGCCHEYYKNEYKFKKFLIKEIKKLDDYLKDENDNPTLCSVRSGAPVSMPGMMDTILNVGIDDSNYDYFCKKFGKKVTNECIIKFMELFCSSRLSLEIKFSPILNKALEKFKNILEDNNIDYNKEEKFPLTKEQQIEQSLYAVFDSWHSERAKIYRNEKSISHNLGTAAIVQQMVFGNLNDNSCTGVVFSRNCLTGENQLVGEFLPKAQGEDVVSGAVTPFSIEKFKAFNPQAYEQLSNIAKKLEQQTGQIQDIEFTVEDGKLYILQHRQAVCSPIAALKLLEDKTLNKEEILKQLEPKALQISSIVQTKSPQFATGLSANSGVLQGIVVREEKDIKKYAKLYKTHKLLNPDFGWIFSTKHTFPHHMDMMNKTDAFITREGGFTSHAAIVARSLNKPCIVGIGENNYLQSGEIITIDADNGKIWRGLQPLIKDDNFAIKASKMILETNKIDLNNVNQKVIENQINIINNKNKLWAFDFPNTHYVKNAPIKLEKFFNIGQRVALVLAADNKHKMKMK